MRRILLSGLIALLMCFSVSAQTPPEVLQPYKSYHVAMDGKDYRKAGKHAYEAWQKSEEVLGDNKTTGNLAYNYANLAFPAKLKSKRVIQAFIRSIDLSDTPLIKMEREYAFADYLYESNNSPIFEKRFDQIVVFAEKNGLQNSTYLGAIYTIRAQTEMHAWRKGGINKYADRALSIFESSVDKMDTKYPMIAEFYAGLGKEFRSNYFDALMHYQKVMRNEARKFPDDHPLIKEALGRWMLMRIKLDENQLELARESGMCDCWPFDKPNVTKAKPVKRVPMRAPDEALRAGRIFGYSVIEFDLDDDGSVLEPRFLEVWPGEFNDKDGLKFIKKWTYSPRKMSETEEHRTNLISTIHYVMLPDETKDGIQEINIIVH